MKLLYWRDLNKVVHILDDSLGDGFTYCSRVPVHTPDAATIEQTPTCFWCVVKHTKYWRIP